MYAPFLNKRSLKIYQNTRYLSRLKTYHSTHIIEKHKIFFRNRLVSQIMFSYIFSYLNFSFTVCCSSVKIKKHWREFNPVVVYFLQMFVIIKLSSRIQPFILCQWKHPWNLLKFSIDKKHDWMISQESRLAFLLNDNSERRERVVQEWLKIFSDRLKFFNWFFS